MDARWLVAGLLVLGLVGCGGEARQAARMRTDPGTNTAPPDGDPREQAPDGPPGEERKPDGTAPDSPAPEEPPRPSDVPDGADPAASVFDKFRQENLELSKTEKPGKLEPKLPNRGKGMKRLLPDDPDVPDDDSPPLFAKADPSEGFIRVPIFYGTDRKRASDEPNTFYGDDRNEEAADPLEFGVCEVSIPPRHETGAIEQPSIWRLEISEDPARHVTLLDVKPVAADRWLASLRQSIRVSRTKSALVFVHGFNVKFDGAARRTAQMKFDLGFDGAAVLFTWPTPKNYFECEGNVDWTKANLRRFLTEYIHHCGAQRIHLVAHSMGTRVLSNALAEIAAASGTSGPRYNQIVLAAPDIDATIFKQQIAPRIVESAERVSIYASSKDLALVASKKAHRYVRLGEGGANLTLFPQYPQIEVLDATAINESLLGHSYYGDSPTILRDLRQILQGFSAVRRGLQRRVNYYALLPSTNYR